MKWETEFSEFTSQGTHISCSLVRSSSKTSSNPCTKRAFCSSTTMQISTKMQTADIFILNLLSQLLEQRPALSSCEKLAEALYITYHKTNTTPPFQRSAEAFIEAKAGFQRVFIVIDALDEYSIGELGPPMELVRDSEELGTSLLIISRITIPFTEGTYTSLPISAIGNDVCIYVSKALGRKHFSRGRADRFEGVVDQVASSAQGMYVSPSPPLKLIQVLTMFLRFLPSKLFLSADSKCKTVDDVEKALLSPLQTSTTLMIQYARTSATRHHGFCRSSTSFSSRRSKTWKTGQCCTI